MLCNMKTLFLFTISDSHTFLTTIMDYFFYKMLMKKADIYGRSKKDQLLCLLVKKERSWAERKSNSRQTYGRVVFQQRVVTSSGIL